MKKKLGTNRMGKIFVIVDESVVSITRMITTRDPKNFHMSLTLYEPCI